MIQVLLFFLLERRRGVISTVSQLVDLDSMDLLHFHTRKVQVDFDSFSHIQVPGVPFSGEIKV